MPFTLSGLKRSLSPVGAPTGLRRVSLARGLKRGGLALWPVAIQTQFPSADWHQWPFTGGRGLICVSRGTFSDATAASAGAHHPKVRTNARLFTIPDRRPRFTSSLE